MVLLLARVGFGSVAQALANAVPAYVAVSLLCYVAFFIVRGIRWKLLLRRVAPGTPIVTAASLSAFGWLVSTVVPMKAGDLARSSIVARRERANLAAVVGTITVERLLDVLGLAAAASLGLLAAATLAHQHLPWIVGEAVAIAWILPILALVGLLALSRVLRRHRERNALLRFVGRFLDAIDELRQYPREVGPLLALSFLITAAQVGVFFFLFLSFRPSASAALVLAGVPLFLLSFAVALVPGNVGTYEAFFILVFASLGFDRANLVAMGLAIHLLTLSIVTVLGGAAFVLDRFTRSSVASPTRPSQVAP